MLMLADVDEIVDTSGFQMPGECVLCMTGGLSFCVIIVYAYHCAAVMVV